MAGCEVCYTCSDVSLKISATCILTTSGVRSLSMKSRTACRPPQHLYIQEKGNPALSPERSLNLIMAEGSSGALASRLANSKHID